MKSVKSFAGHPVSGVSKKLIKASSYKTQNIRFWDILDMVIQRQYVPGA